MLLELKNLLPQYFDQSATTRSEIWGKELRFEKGEYIKIVAPSGSGKTSLMHFLYGVRQDYEGTVSYNSKSIKKKSAEEIASLRKDHVSIVFQDMKLFTEETVFDNINIKRQLNPYHPKERISEMAESLGIGSKLNAKCLTCSYGEQQRIAIIRALMQPFDILLLDEPFSHLDNRNSEIAMQLIMHESKQRTAAVIFADLERIDYFPFTSIYHL
jgi:putative ABC transport system ATP-binding protein